MPRWSRAALSLVVVGWTLPVFAAPNVVLIVADDLGWNDVGYNGSEIRTPRLDSLAADGVVLHQFHAQPVCTPTRAALMTGKNPQRLGIYQPFTKNTASGLPADEVTLTDYLSDAGYQTWMVGKWHLGYAKREYHPNGRGFEHFYGNVTGGVGHFDHVHGGGLDWQRNGVTVRETGYVTHLLTAEATRLISDRDPDRPFFLYLSFSAPHMPNEAPQSALDAYASISSRFRRAHAAMVTEMDSAIGQVVDRLASAGVLRNTMLWFMSDNGGLNRHSQSSTSLVTFAQTLQDLFGAPVSIPILELIRTNTLEGGSDNQPLRHGKGSIYEGGTRVPALVYWPGFLPRHRPLAPVTVQDILPTLLTALGIHVPADLDGGDRWPVLLGSAEPPARDFVTRGLFTAQAYYQWPWKLVSDGDLKALYRLDRDPTEQHDLAGQYPERTGAMSELLDQIPRAPSLHVSAWRTVLDPDFFGGQEDRPPWAERTDWGDWETPPGMRGSKVNNGGNQ